MIKCEKVLLRDFAVCPQWGGDQNRQMLLSRDADLLLDLEARTLTVIAHRGEGFAMPLEMVRQWFPQRTASGAARAAPEPESTDASAPARRSGTRRSRAQ